MTKTSIPMTTEPLAPEFSRLIELATLSAAGIHREIQAEPAEREALARRFDLAAIAVLTAQLDVVPIRSGGVTGARVTGRFAARVTQTCVVSLERFESDLAERIELDLLPPAVLEAGEDADLYHDQDVEPLEGSVLDIGELVAQHLSLALDPHPRRPGVSFEPARGLNADPDASAGSKPFAALGDLKRKM